MLLTSITYGLAALMGLGIIIIGARALLVPRAAAAGFGLAVGRGRADIDALMAIKGVRDIATGLITFALLIAGTAHVVGWFIVAAAFIPLSDAVIVLRHNGPKIIAYGVHAATAAVMLALAVGFLFS